MLIRRLRHLTGSVDMVGRALKVFSSTATGWLAIEERVNNLTAHLDQIESSLEIIIEEYSQTNVSSSRSFRSTTALHARARTISQDLDQLKIEIESEKSSFYSVVLSINARAQSIRDIKTGSAYSDKVDKALMHVETVRDIPECLQNLSASIGRVRKLYVEAKKTLKITIDNFPGDTKILKGQNYLDHKKPLMDKYTEIFNDKVQADLLGSLTTMVVVLRKTHRLYTYKNKNKK